MSYTHADSMRGHVAIVTGAAQGVGKGVAAALLERGAEVLLVDIQAEVLSATTAELKAIGRVEQLVADLQLLRPRPALAAQPEGMLRTSSESPRRRRGRARSARRR